MRLRDSGPPTPRGATRLHKAAPRRGARRAGVGGVFRRRGGDQDWGAAMDAVSGL